MIGIYKITSPSGRIYIGSSINIRKRLNAYKNLRCKKQVRLYNSLIKYGFLNHTVSIEEECSTDIMLEREAYFGNLYNTLSQCGLNCKLPKISDTYQNIRTETLELMRAIKKLQKGKPHTEEAKRKISIAHTGKKLSIEHIEKMRKSKTGKKMSPAALEKARNRVTSDDTKLKLSIAGKGKKRSAEFCARLSKINTGKKHSAETRKKISDIQGIKVINTITGELFNSTREASKSLGMGKNYICQKSGRGASIYPMAYI